MKHRNRVLRWTAVFVAGSLVAESAMAQQLSCLVLAGRPTTAFGFLATIVESLRHAKAAADLEPDSAAWASGQMNLLYRYRAAADEYHCAATLVSAALTYIRDTSLSRSAFLVYESFKGLGENDSARADIVRNLLNASNSPRGVALGTFVDNVSTLKLDSEKLGQALGMGLLLTVQYFNADAPGSARMLTRGERDSLLGRLKAAFGRGVGLHHRETKGNDYGTALAAELYQLLSDPHWRLR